MSVSCQPVDLADLAKCFECLTKRQLEQIQVYLLALKAGGSIDPGVLLALAKCFECLTPPQFKAVQAYILCQIANGSTPEGSSLLNELFAYWKMDEDSGTRLAANAVGPPLGEVTVVSSVGGKIGNGAGFAPAPDDGNYLETTSEVVLSVDFTVCAWVYFNDAVAGGIIGIANSWQIYFDSEGIVFAAAPDGITWVPVVSPALPDQWYFVRAWFTSTDNTIHLRLNEGAEMTAVLSGPISGSDVLTVAKDVLTGIVLFGTIDEVGLWQRVLTNAEAAILYNMGAGTPYPWT